MSTGNHDVEAARIRSYEPPPVLDVPQSRPETAQEKWERLDDAATDGYRCCRACEGTGYEGATEATWPRGTAARSWPACPCCDGCGEVPV